MTRRLATTVTRSQGSSSVNLRDDFARAQDDWREALGLEVAQWQRDYGRLIEKDRVLHQKGLWVSGPIDYLGVLHRSRSELDHSKVVGWLLDPGMHHGLGDRLLRRVLNRCFPDTELPSLAGASTEYEVPSGRCRADIIVRTPRLTLVIENKVDADEIPEQCDGLFAEFGTEPGACFVFLTPRGRAPKTATGESAEAFCSLSYRAIRRDLGVTLKETAKLVPGKARRVAEDYLMTLKRKFS